MELSEKRRRNQLRININMTHDQLRANSCRQFATASMSLMGGFRGGEEGTRLVSSRP